MEFVRLQELLESSLTTADSPNNLFGNIDDDFWFWLHTEGYRSNSELQRVLPAMPDEDVQVRLTGSKGDRTLSEGFQAYKLFKRLFEENVGRLATCEGVLDFGCGWGRILRFFLKDLEPSKLWGTNMMAFHIDACK